MSKTKIAVVGVGGAARHFHLPCLTKFDDVEVTLCDAWPGPLKEGMRRWKIPAERAFVDLDEMMEKTDPDGVYVLFPQYSLKGRPPSPYMQIVPATIAYGKPIFVEKPLAMNYPDATLIADAAEKAGIVTTQVGFQRRFHPLLREALKRIRQRGPLLNCYFGFFKGAKASHADTVDMANYDELTGDFVHMLDLMRWVPESEMTDFFSTTGRIGGEPNLTQWHAVGRFKDGCTSFFMSNKRAGARVLEFKLHGIGISAYVTMNPDGEHISSMVATIFTDNDFDNPQVIYDYQLAPNRSSQACVGFWQENRHFVDCVQQGIETDCSFADAAKTNELCQRILNKSEGMKV